MFKLVNIYVYYGNKNMSCMSNHTQKMCVCVHVAYLAPCVILMCRTLVACLVTRALKRATLRPRREQERNLKTPPNSEALNRSVSGAPRRLSAVIGPVLHVSISPQRYKVAGKDIVKDPASEALFHAAISSARLALVLQTGATEVADNISPHGLRLQQPAAENTAGLQWMHTMALKSGTQHCFSMWLEVIQSAGAEVHKPQDVQVTC